MAVYKIDENLTPVLLSACFVSFAGLVLGLGLVTADLVPTLCTFKNRLKTHLFLQSYFVL